MNINKIIEKFNKQNNIDYFGIADISKSSKFITNQGGKQLRKYNYAISIGIKIPNEIIEILIDKDKKKVIKNYKIYGYDSINKRLNKIAADLNKLLKNNGLNTLVINASKRIDKNKIAGKFSHKLAAHLAGLGWIGKSCLLITPDNGPRVRWITILVEDGLEKTGEPIDERCGECVLCKNICPANAIKGVNFDSKNSREARLDAEKCQSYQDVRIEEPTNVCGLCIYICPYGRE